MTLIDPSPVNSVRSSTAREAVRLVVWDLDETYWKGTLTEGGISEYVQEHHEAVIELARRGIMSSICSRNDPDQVLAILGEKGILDYFIFPSISWQSKGARLAALIETIQLRPASVMFIDDNPSNLAEARATIPDIQVEGVDFIDRMLEDPRFKGKSDSGLTRLAQYKLLETRKRDEVQHSGDNSEFLRGCDIRVHIEHDVLSHLDRAIELVNRTNQLNYTKHRLPEDLDAARAELTRDCTGNHRQAGLVRVVDKYGDYGFVGFYATRNRRKDPTPGLTNHRLVHYCFSCRTLGMFVEHWLYDHLRRPALEVVGEVLTDLNEPRTVDWIRQVSSISEDTQRGAKLAPEIRFCGGCEANSVGHYFGPYCDRVSVTGNFQAGPLFVRTNSCFLLLSATDNVHHGAFERETALLGIPPSLMGTCYFQHAPEGTIFVFNGGLDSQAARLMRHRIHGWVIHAKPVGDSIEFMSASEDDIARIVAETKSGDQRRLLKFAIRHIRENYEVVGADKRNFLESAMEELVRRVPRGCKFIMLLDDDRRRTKKGEVRIKPGRVRYNDWVRSFAERFPFVGVTSFSDAILSEEEILEGGNHYARTVYWRAAENIVKVARRLAPKPEHDTSVSVGNGRIDLSLLLTPSEPRRLNGAPLVPSISEETRSAARLAPEIRIFGGGGADAWGQYLGAYCDRVSVTGNFEVSGLSVLVNSCFLLLSATDFAGRVAFEEEMSFLGISAPLMGTGYFRNAPEGTVFAFSGGFDAQSGIRRRLRHRVHGWEIHVTSGDGSDLVSAPDEHIRRVVAEQKTEDERCQFERAIRHIRDNYETVGYTGSSLESAMEELVQRVPQGCKLVLLLDDERRRRKDGKIRTKRVRVSYNDWVRSFAERFPFVGVMSFSDAVQRDDEILQGSNHYARTVYSRAAEKLVEVVRQLAPKEGEKSGATIDERTARPKERGENDLRTRGRGLEAIWNRVRQRFFPPRRQT